MTATKALKFLSTVCVLMVAALGPVLPVGAAPAGTPADPPPDVPGNLLTNPGFEAPYSKQCCHDEPNFPPGLPIDEVQVANGWSGWWRQPSFPDYPPRCDDAQAPKQNCVAFHRPEWRDAATGGATFDVYRYRIHSGFNAQKYFTFYSIHESGMFQQVTNGVQPGQRLRFTAYLQGWSTNSDQITSAGQQSMTLKVGIDPFGGTNAFSPNIIWSEPNNSFDVYTQFGVEAVAQSNKVTVFTYSRPIYALQHNDVYVDDAALTVVGSGAVQPVAAPVVAPPVDVVAAQPPQTVVFNGTSPFPGTAVDSNGNIVYIVQPGDTTFSLARRFGTTVQQLMVWNNLYSSTYILAWTPLIVGRASVVSAPAAPAPAPVIAATAAPVALPSVSPYPGTSLDSYGDIVYVVQPGDTTFSIALRFGTSVWQIVTWNNLYSSTYIQAGQLLIVGKVQ